MKIKAIGIVRRIDDLGRVVIPKEIRDVQDMPVGTPVEFFVAEEGLVIRKYQTMEEEQEQIIDDLSQVLWNEKDPKAIDVLKHAIEYLKKK